MQQRFSQFTGKQTASAHRYCQQCGTAMAQDARFCSHCGAQQEAQPVQEDNISVEADYVEARPTVLKNDQEEIPDLFDFQPVRSVVQPKPKGKRQRAFNRMANQNTEPFEGYYRMDAPSCRIDLRVYQENNIVYFEYYDVINGRHVYEFEGWNAGGEELYCHAWDYTFKLTYHENGRMELDTYGRYPGLSGFYISLD